MEQNTTSTEKREPLTFEIESYGLQELRECMDRVEAAAEEIEAQSDFETAQDFAYASYENLVNACVAYIRTQRPEEFEANPADAEALARSSVHFEMQMIAWGLA